MGGATGTGCREGPYKDIMFVCSLCVGMFSLYVTSTGLTWPCVSSAASAALPAGLFSPVSLACGGVASGLASSFVSSTYKMGGVHTPTELEPQKHTFFPVSFDSWFALPASLLVSSLPFFSP